MPRILVLSHSPTASTGWLGRVLDEAGAEVRMHNGLDDPDVEYRDENAVVVLGGSMGAYDEDRYPFLSAEKALFRGLVERDVPLLGICLGSQMLADALGGRAYLADRPEVGFLAMRHTEAGREDRVTAVLGTPVLVLHQDTFEVPPDATLLAHTDGFPHAFRLGSALAFQFHAEADPDILAGWMKRDGLRRLVTRGGWDPEAFVADADARRDASEAQALDLFRAWASSVFD